ncbi:MAG: pyridoxamine 5'-phosphate oxidase family protein [Planctomycetaceae bacterium]
MSDEQNSPFPVTDRNRVQRVPKRGHYDRDTVYSVIDAAWVGHVGIVDRTTKHVAVIPLMHAREGDELIFHGAKSSRLIKHLGSGEGISVAFTLVDGLVLAKSLYHHSMNYRSAVVFGTGRIAESEVERLSSLQSISNKVMPGRWNDARQPNEKELAGTGIVRVKIDSASAKVRTGDPVDDPEDMGLPIWSGVVPLSESIGQPLPDGNSEGIAVPKYLQGFGNPA